MSTSVRSRSAFVPHDLKAPIAPTKAGVLSGLTVAIKDMYDIAGERRGGGNPDWLAQQSPAQRHSAVVERLLNAGATIIGKTVCDEFFYSVAGVNAHYGTPLNPRSPDRIPGGSSSGSASAAASGCCDLAVGSDTGGSVRIPSALCGLYGIRVSRDRVDLTGAMAMAPSLDAGGWMAATPGVFARAGEALLENYKPAAPNAIERAVLLEDAFANADPRIKAMGEEFLRIAQSAMPPVSRGTMVEGGTDPWREAMRIVQAYEVWQSFGEFLTKHDAKLGPGVAERMKRASTITAEQQREGRKVLAQATTRAEALAQPGCILILPTAPSVAPLIAATPEELDAYRVGVMRLTCIASISGLPQVTVPIGTLDDAPVGLSLIGWGGSDEALLALARALAPWVGLAH